MLFKTASKNKYLITAFIVALIPIILIVAISIKGIYDKNEYNSFIFELGTKIDFYGEHNLITVKSDTGNAKLSEDNADLLYLMLVDLGFSYYKDEVPVQSDSIILEFADSESLQIVPESDLDKTYLLLKYVDSNGEEYTCATAVETEYIKLKAIIN